MSTRVCVSVCNALLICYRIKEGKSLRNFTMVIHKNKINNTMVIFISYKSLFSFLFLCILCLWFEDYGLIMGQSMVFRRLICFFFTYKLFLLAYKWTTSLVLVPTPTWIPLHSAWQWFFFLSILGSMIHSGLSGVGMILNLLLMPESQAFDFTLSCFLQWDQ